VLGITGTGGAGKSSLVDELVRRFLLDFADKTIAIISRGPHQAQDRRRPAGRPHPHEQRPRPARLHALARHPAVQPGAVAPRARGGVDICKAAGFDLVIVETSGIGQSDTEIVDHSDVSLYVMTPSTARRRSSRRSTCSTSPT
jgi:isobutyryl-CoA mutase